MNIKVIFNQIRYYQWVKNLLIFLPIILSPTEISFELVISSLFAFLSFSLIASSVYTFNDIIDIDADRLHPFKKKRPLASNKITINNALLLLFSLLALGIYIGLLVSVNFIYLLAVYLLFNIAYTIIIKKLIIIDIIFLTIFYTLRVIGGSIVVVHFNENIVPSEWFLSFTIFLFFSLGALKRYVDISLISNKSSNYAHERGYTYDDRNLIQIIGISSGMISSLIIVLYTGSDSVRSLYSFPVFIVSSVPAFIYWLSRLWYLGSKGKINSDPIRFTIKDASSYFVFIYLVFVFIFAKYF